MRRPEFNSGSFCCVLNLIWGRFAAEGPQKRPQKRPPTNDPNKRPQQTTPTNDPNKRPPKRPQQTTPSASSAPHAAACSRSRDCARFAVAVASAFADAAAAAQLQRGGLCEAPRICPLVPFCCVLQRPGVVLLRSATIRCSFSRAWAHPLGH